MSKSGRTLIFTFDHELFLGKRSGTAENCMIKPVEELLKISEKFGAGKFLFFVDTTYLQRLRENQQDDFCKSEWKKIELQIQRLLKRGHYIFPHIHPHWLDANLTSDKQWELNNLSKYCFKNCTLQEKDKVWNDAISILTELGVSEFHPIDAFRAGGWSIQPFSAFEPYFAKHYIKYDFSVLPGAAANTNAQQFDFSNAPEKPCYKFLKSVELEDPNGIYCEFPISVRTVGSKKSFSERLLLKWLSKTGIRSFGDGQGVIPQKSNVQKSSTSKSVEMISLELLNAVTYSDYKKQIDSHECVQFISHPKMLTQHNLKYFGKLLRYATEKYKLDFDFRSLLNA